MRCLYIFNTLKFFYIVEFLLSWAFVWQHKINVLSGHMAVSTYVWTTELRPITVNATRATCWIRITKPAQVRQSQQTLSHYFGDTNLQFPKREILQGNLRNHASDILLCSQTKARIAQRAVSSADTENMDDFRKWLGTGSGVGDMRKAQWMEGPYPGTFCSSVHWGLVQQMGNPRGSQLGRNCLVW